MSNATSTGATLTETRIRAGIWEGVLVPHGPSPRTEGSGAKAPAPSIEILHEGKPVGKATLAPLPGAPGRFAVRAPVPAETLSDGVQTFVLRLVGQDEPLGHFSLVIGGGAETDLRVELDLLRAELDMLKRAFRRHCLETRP